MDCRSLLASVGITGEDADRSLASYDAAGSLGADERTRLAGSPQIVRQVELAARYGSDAARLAVLLIGSTGQP